MSTVNWKIHCNKNWLTVSNASGSNNATIFVSAQANTSTKERKATITVSSKGLKSKTITVIQEASPAVLNVSTNNLNLEAADNSTSDFDIISNVNWKLRSNQCWLTFSKVSGSNNAAITVSAKANSSSKPRTAIITVSGNGISSKTITVTQAGKSAKDNIIISDRDVKLFPVPVADKLYISVSKQTEGMNAVIYAINGSVVSSFIINNNITEVDMSKYKSGLYFMKIITPDNCILVKKIIKQ
jgi:hypothetical protein